MSRYVEKGTMDAGLTGKDWVLENESDVVVVDDLDLLQGEPESGKVGPGGSLQIPR
jgi:ATP phosphoribosyltransferase